MRSLAFATAAMFIASAVAVTAQSAPTHPTTGGATAPSAPQAPPAPPRVFVAAGYAQPDITPGMCKNVDPSRTICTIPGMTAGSYLVEAVGTSTATAAAAAQRLIIAAGRQSCSITRGSDPKAPWAVGTPRPIAAACLFTIVSDEPVTVVTEYADQKATKDPKGPQLAVRRAEWQGVLSAAAIPVQVQQSK